MATNRRGNPDWIASGWGEQTKAAKIPVRLADRLQELREDGWSTDDILTAIDAERDLSEIVDLLEEALTLKPNAGGAIKKVIREALELLSQQS